MSGLHFKNNLCRGIKLEDLKKIWGGGGGGNLIYTLTEHLVRAKKKWINNFLRGLDGG